MICPHCLYGIRIHTVFLFAWVISHGLYRMSYTARVNPSLYSSSSIFQNRLYSHNIFGEKAYVCFYDFSKALLYCNVFFYFFLFFLSLFQLINPLLCAINYLAISTLSHFRIEWSNESILIENHSANDRIQTSQNQSF